MNWIREHKFITFLILVICAAVGFLVFALSTGGAGTGAEGAAGGVFGRIAQPVARLGENISGVFSSGDLRAKNEQLEKENRQLQEELRKQRLQEDDKTDLEALKKALNYRGSGDTEKLVSGDVTAMNGNSWIRTFTINLGTEDGLKAGSVVLNGDGLIGQVRTAGHGWAKVTTILDSTKGLSFCLENSRKTMGVLNVSSSGELTGYMLDRRAKVKKGDRVVTSGMGVYPERITIGKVSQAKYDKQQQLLRVTVEPAVQFNALRKVAVLV